MAAEAMQMGTGLTPFNERGREPSLGARELATNSF